MANPVPAGSDVSAGTYRCTNCGNELEVGSTEHLPPCPSCGCTQRVRWAARVIEPEGSTQRRWCCVACKTVWDDVLETLP